MVAQHDFYESLRRSEKVATADWWQIVYRQAFPDFESMSEPVQDLQQQRRGIDRVITLTGGAQIFVDEKVRKNTWTDVLLEKWSVQEQGKPGWISKPLYCDYLAYAFLSSKVCWMLPFQQLRRAWVQHEREWTQRYGTIPVKNKDYTTVCVPVPIAVVMQATMDALWTTWETEDGLPF